MLLRPRSVHSTFSDKICHPEIATPTLLLLSSAKLLGESGLSTTYVQDPLRPAFLGPVIVMATTRSTSNTVPFSAEDDAYSTVISYGGCCSLNLMKRLI